MVNGQNQEKQQKEEQVTATLKWPVSFSEQIAGQIFGGGSASEITKGAPTPGEAAPPPGQPGGMGMFSAADKDAVLKRMGNPPPGVQLPEPTAPEPTAPEAQPELPTRADAYSAAREPLPKVTTREEFERDVKKPSWWRKMLGDFAAGKPGGGMEGFEKKAEEAYQKHIEPQLREREEQARLAGVEEKFMKPGMKDIGRLIGLDEAFEVPESQLGAYAGAIQSFRDAKRQKTVNFSDWLEGAPDVEFPPDMAKSMIPLISKMMEEDKTSSWPDFIRKYPEKAKEWERFKSELSKDEEAAKDSSAKQTQPDLFSDKKSLVSDPGPMREYLELVGEEFVADDKYSLGPDGEDDGAPRDVSGFADNYLWQRNKNDPRYKDWSEKFLKNEGLAYRVGGIVERFKGSYRSINTKMRLKKIPQASVDKFLGYHFPEEHEKDMKKRGVQQSEIDKIIKRTQADVVPSGGVIQGRGAQREAGPAAIKAYAEAVGITEAEAEEAFRADSTIRIVGR